MPSLCAVPLLNFQTTDAQERGKAQTLLCHLQPPKQQYIDMREANVHHNVTASKNTYQDEDTDLLVTIDHGFKVKLPQAEKLSGTSWKTQCLSCLHSELENQFLRVLQRQLRPVVSQNHRMQLAWCLAGFPPRVPL